MKTKVKIALGFVIAAAFSVIGTAFALDDYDFEDAPEDGDYSFSAVAGRKSAVAKQNGVTWMYPDRVAGGKCQPQAQSRPVQSEATRGGRVPTIAEYSAITERDAMRAPASVSIPSNRAGRAAQPQAATVRQAPIRVPPAADMPELPPEPPQVTLPCVQQSATAEAELPPFADEAMVDNRSRGQGDSRLLAMATPRPEPRRSTTADIVLPPPSTKARAVMTGAAPRQVQAATMPTPAPVAAVHQQAPQAMAPQQASAPFVASPMYGTGMLRFIFGSSRPAVYSSYHNYTDIELQHGERLDKIMVGNPDEWETTAVVTGGTPHVIVRPLCHVSATTMIAVTDRRVYYFDLSASTRHMDRVGFIYTNGDPNDFGGNPQGGDAAANMAAAIPATRQPLAAAVAPAFSLPTNANGNIELTPGSAFCLMICAGALLFMLNQVIIYHRLPK